MKNWDELRTVYYVARLGTISAAADRLGLHRVTVNRHIELLENDLGEPLFLRGAQGYAPTEAGVELMRVAQAAEEAFDRMAARIRAQVQLNAGELVVTSLPEATPLILPALAAFRAAHTDVVVRHVATSKTLKLDGGEAHLAVRSAPMADQPNTVVEPFAAIRLSLFASPAYLAEHGAPSRLADLRRHRFVAPEPMDASNTARLHNAWLAEMGVEDRVVFRSTSLSALDHAIAAGIGLGLSPDFCGRRLGLTRLDVENSARLGRLNLVVHEDWLRAPRVQALVDALRAHAPTVEAAVSGAVAPPFAGEPA